MEYVNSFGEFYRVNRSVCVSIIINHNLQNFRAAKPNHRDGVESLLALLSEVDAVPCFTPYFGREFAKILFFVFLVLFLLGLVFNLSTGKRSGIV